MRETALITGASGGLGEEFARLFAADGCDLVLVARSEDALQGLKKELEEQHHIRVLVIAQDLSEPGAIAKIGHELQRSDKEITTLVNNAGFGAYGFFHEVDWMTPVSMIELNVLALTSLTRLLLPGMVVRQHGRILNIASTAAFQPGPLMAVYYASKAYVLNFSLALSDELRGTGVTCTCLCPGPTRTGFEKTATLQGSPLFRLGTMDAKTVAMIGYRACMQGRPLVTAGFRNKLGAFLTRFAPRMLTARVARRAQEKI